MAVKQQPMLFAFDETGEIKHIEEVERGAACGCVCPACGKKLIAKKGDRRLKIHHFAHAPGVDCEYGYESSLHLAAKRILEKAPRITVPDVYVEFPHSFGKRVVFSRSKEISIDSVALEVHLRNIIPDIVIRSKERTLIVEIFVTHAIDKDKAVQIENKNISAIEIDLSEIDRYISLEELTHILIDDVQKKRWIYNAKELEQRKKFIEKSRKYVVKTVSNSKFQGEFELIPDCPLSSRLLAGNLCAEYWHDCVRCLYYVGECFDEEGMRYVQCTCEEYIADCSDFSIDKNERIEKNKEKQLPSYMKRVEEAICNLEEKMPVTCPNCGCALREKEGKHGRFWGCCMHPDCRFAIWYNTQKEGYEFKR